MSRIASTLRFLKRTLAKPEGRELKDLGPVSRTFGLDRGTPIDRYYIAKFIQRNKQLIRGDLIEIGKKDYSNKYLSSVDSVTVLHAVPGNSEATLVGDLTRSHDLPAEKFDCFICTQTLNFIYDLRAALAGCYKILKPGGVILATVSGISQVSQYDMSRWGDYWRFTTLSAQKLFEEQFEVKNVKVDFFGNCLAATSLLRGICAEELETSLLDKIDVDYPVTITIVAKKTKVIS